MITFEVEIEQRKRAYLEIEAETEKEADEKARVLFHEMLIEGTADDEEINVTSIDWEEEGDE